VTSDILFILILVELFRLLIIYLQEQRISVGSSGSFNSVLREVIIREVLEIPGKYWQSVLPVSSEAINSCLDGTDITIRM